MTDKRFFASLMEEGLTFRPGRDENIFYCQFLIRDHDVFSHLENICCRIPKFYFLLFYRLLSLHLEFRTKGENEFLTCLCYQF